MNWIDCKHKLPKDEDLVLCYGNGEIFIGYHTSDGWQSMDFEMCMGTLSFEPVRFWMPLPPAPNDTLFSVEVPFYGTITFEMGEPVKDRILGID